MKCLGWGWVFPLQVDLQTGLSEFSVLQRRLKHGWNEFSVENTEPIWKKYLDQVRILCTDPHFLAKPKTWLGCFEIEIFRIFNFLNERSLGRGCALGTGTAPSPGKTIVRLLCSSLRVQITSPNRNEPFLSPHSPQIKRWRSGA